MSVTWLECERTGVRKCSAHEGWQVCGLRGNEVGKVEVND